MYFFLELCPKSEKNFQYIFKCSSLIVWCTNRNMGKVAANRELPFCKTHGKDSRDDI